MNIFLVTGGGHEHGWACLGRTVAVAAWLRDVWPSARVTVFAEGDHQVHDWLWHRVRDLVALRSGCTALDHSHVRELQGAADLVLVDRPGSSDAAICEAWLPGTRNLLVRTPPTRLTPGTPPVVGWTWDAVSGSGVRMPIIGTQRAWVDPRLREGVQSATQPSEVGTSVLLNLGSHGDSDRELETVRAVAAGQADRLTVVTRREGRRYRRDLQAVAANVDVVREREHVSSLLVQADLAVVADSDAALDAAAAGTPSIVIGTDAPVPEAARLVASNDFAAITSEVSDLLADPSSRDALAAAGTAAVDGFGLQRLLMDALPTFPVEMLQVAHVLARKGPEQVADSESAVTVP